MSTLLPLLALVVAIVALFLAPPVPADEEASKPPGMRGIARGPELGLLVLFAASLAATWFYQKALTNGFQAAIGFGVGGAAVTIAHYMGLRRAVSAAVSIGLAAAFAGFIHWGKAEQVFPTQLGFVLGAGVASWLFAATHKEALAATACGVAAGAIVATDVLAQRSLQFETAWQTGVALGLVAACVALIVAILGDKGPIKPWHSALAGTALLAGGGWIVANRFVNAGDAFLLFAGAVVAGAAVHWLMSEEDSTESVRFVLAAVVWLGLATWGFALRRGFGMSVCLLGATSMLLIVRNPRALLTLGPLLALVFYRLFREAHVDASRALDIGQHYALVGICIGAVVPMLPLEWLRAQVAGTNRVVAATLWSLVFVGLPVGCAILLGPKGVIGMIAGLGLACFLEGLRGSRSLASLAIASGVAAFVTLSFDWLNALLSLTRDEKLKTLYWIIPGLVVLAVLIATLSGKPQVKEALA